MNPVGVYLLRGKRLKPALGILEVTHLYYDPDERPYERAVNTKNPDYREQLSAAEIDAIIDRRMAESSS